VEMAEAGLPFPVVFAVSKHLRVSEEILPARILFDTEAATHEQSAKRLSHFRLVIQYCNHWSCSWHRRESLVR